jgi:predicted choloylglycine hydrolase
MDWQSAVDEIVRRWVPGWAGIGEHGGAGVEGGRRRLTFRSHSVPRIDGRLKELFEERWPDFRRWYLRDGESARPSAATARSALERHMPELVSVWERVVEVVGADELGARMLSMYDPPALMSGCSQVALPGAPVLIRNYDYDLDLFDGTVLETRLAGRRVIGTGDQLWGLLDGVNDDGLAVSFTFGGRRDVGRGFSMPLIVRYVLETCADVADGVAALRRLPVQTAYTVTLIDRHGDHTTVMLGPDTSAEVTAQRAATNHQRAVHWPAHARWTRSVERLERLDALLAQEPPDAGDVVAAMLSAPLRATDLAGGFATLYTAVYRPGEGSVEYRWPGLAFRQSLSDFREQRLEVELGADEWSPR